MAPNVAPDKLKERFNKCVTTMAKFLPQNFHAKEKQRKFKKNF